MSAGGDRCALAAIDAAYTLDGCTTTWLKRILGAAAPQLDRGGGVLGWAFELDSNGTHRFASPVVGDEAVSPDVLRRFVARDADGDQEGPARRVTFFEQALRHGCPSLESAVAALERVPMSTGAAGPGAHVLQDLAAWGVADVLGAHAVDVEGHGVVLCGPAPARQSIDRVEARRWARVMVHLVSAMRLRRALDRRAAREEAILAPDGRVVHAEGEARAQARRDALRAAARQIDRARSRRGRRAPGEALEAWKGLVEGRWTLVDRFESDGRRYFIARRNEPEPWPRRRLSLRERQVAAYAALGYPNKVIAYTLGLAPSTVSSHLRAAMQRLGARDRADLAALVPPGDGSLEGDE